MGLYPWFFAVAQQQYRFRHTCIVPRSARRAGLSVQADRYCFGERVLLVEHKGPTSSPA